MGYGQGHQIRFGPKITRIVKYLVISNAVIFIWMALAGLAGGNEIVRIFGLTPALVTTKLYLWQLITYLFLHGGFFHILFNMFALWMFGAELENRWGSKQFLKYYFITGIGAGVISILAEPFAVIPTIGASGAVYGILMAYGMMFPNRYIYVYFLFPVKVKYLVAFLAILAFMATLGSPGSTVAHIAHLGGMLVGFLYLKGWLSFSLVKKKYHEWRMKKLRSRFRVYEKKRQKPKKEDDFWIN